MLVVALTKPRTPYQQNDANTCALIAQGLGIWSKSTFHICLSNADGNGTIYNAAISDSRLSVDANGLVNILGSLTVNNINIESSINSKQNTLSNLTGTGVDLLNGGY